MLQTDVASAGSGRMAEVMLMGANREPDGARWQELPTCFLWQYLLKKCSVGCDQGSRHPAGAGRAGGGGGAEQPREAEAEAIATRGSAQASAGAAGSSIRNVEPFPGTLFATSVPPWAVAMA